MTLYTVFCTSATIFLNAELQITKKKRSRYALAAEAVTLFVYLFLIILLSILHIQLWIVFDTVKLDVFVWLAKLIEGYIYVISCADYKVRMRYCVSYTKLYHKNCDQCFRACCILCTQHMIYQCFDIIKLIRICM